jgi:hypothetical protein
MRAASVTDKLHRIKIAVERANSKAKEASEKTAKEVRLCLLFGLFYALVSSDAFRPVLFIPQLERKFMDHDVRRQQFLDSLVLKSKRFSRPSKRAREAASSDSGSASASPNLTNKSSIQDMAVDQPSSSTETFHRHVFVEASASFRKLLPVKALGNFEALAKALRSRALIESAGALLRQVTNSLSSSGNPPAAKEPSPRVFLTSFMVASHPDAIFSNMGDEEKVRFFLVPQMSR